MVVEGVVAEGEEDQVPPASVGGRLGLEDDRDEEAYVLDAPCLVVELHLVGLGRIVPDDRSRSRGRGPDVRRGRKAEELLGVADLVGQVVGRVALALPSESGLTHAGPASAAAARAVARAVMRVESVRSITGGGGGAGKGAAPIAARGPAASPLDRAPLAVSSALGRVAASRGMPRSAAMAAAAPRA